MSAHRPRPLPASAALALALTVLVAPDPGCSRSATPSEPPPVYFDPARHLDTQQVLDGGRLHADVWTLADQPRPVLFQHPPSRVRLTLSEPERATLSEPERSGCVLRFSLGIKDDAWPRSDGVRFRIWTNASNGANAETQGDPTFDELLDPRSIGAAAWQPREIALPAFAGELVFATDAGPAGNLDFDHAGWAAPHVECPASDTAASEDTLSPQAASPKRPHVVLISLDTLRRDHLGLYGHSADTSPTLDALARESWVFDRAFAVAPFTLPTHASIFTGLYPHEHGAGHAAPFVPLGPDAATLAEELARSGYRTLGFTAGGIMSHRNGLQRGFQEWMERTRAPIDSMLPSVYAALGTHPTQPFFLFLHTYDIHGPYPTPIALARAETAGAPASAAEWERIRRIGYHDYLALDRFRSVDDVVTAYDEGIRRVDRALASLFERLRALGIWEDTLVIVTSDHGESLYERGQYIGHSYSLYDEEVRIPLLVRLPGGGPARRSDELVDQVDLMPTILAAAGVVYDGPQSGSDALARARGEAPARASVEGEAAHTGARYVRTQHWKLIGAAYPPGDERSRLPGAMHDRFIASPQLFDAESDAAEATNRYSEDGASVSSQGGQSAEVAALERLLASRPRPGHMQLERSDFGPDMLRQLRELGYVE